jgi:hypothetical protein
LDGGVTTADIADDAVTTAKLATQTGNVDFADYARIRLGDSQDLQIYHDGSNSFINDTGTGALAIVTNGANVNIQKSPYEPMIVAHTDGAVDLYHNNALKLATTATGVAVTGAISSNKGSAGLLATFSDGVNSNFVVETSSLLTTIGNGGGSTALALKANNTEKMRITAAGDVLIGTQTKETSGTTLYGSTVNGFYVKTTSTCGYLITQAGVGGAGFFISLYSDNTAVGSITTNGSSTSYGTSSDYRLKENVTADWDATTRLKQLNPVRFNFIADADTTVDGFLAHEVQSVVPEAITGTKDGMRDEEYEVTPAVEATYDDDGNILTEEVPAVMGTRSVPDYQGIDQGKLIPLLVKSLQEALTKIDEQSLKIGELETRIASLEAN